MSQNAKLAAIANEAAENLRDLVKNHEEKILEAWNAADQEAQDQDAKPKFRLALAITLDLDADSMETALTFGIRYKASRDQQIPDPAQGELQGIDTVTLTTIKGDTVTASLPVFKAALHDLKRQKANKT